MKKMGDPFPVGAGSAPDKDRERDSDTAGVGRRGIRMLERIWGGGRKERSVEERGEGVR